MTAIDLGRVRRLIELVHDATPGERDAILRRECGSDTALRAEVEDLLRAADDGAALLDAPHGLPRAADLVPDADAALVPGARVGGFQLVQRVASGGMGTVWEALQDEPRRKVALKTIRANASREALRRFRHESQILARLRHPNVAQVIASGVHTLPGGDGVPWFALEFVEDARTLVDFARERSLGVRARLELFVALCDAVQHGHERGVIHRDLKPNNVLVDGSGTLKVIDFGVARVRDPSGERSSLDTEAGRLIGTLQYMSPEQVSGSSDGVDTRSDVYALGVLLYELVAGAPPYDLSGASLAEAARVLVAEVPPRPGARVPGLSPDVDAIALKALEKERARRYESAAALAQDVRRHLRGETVEARGPGLAYQLATFARRHILIVASLAVVLVVLAAAAAFSVRSASEARSSEQRALLAAGSAREAALDAIAQRELARSNAYTVGIAAAYAAIRSQDAGSARQQLDRCPENLRGFEWWYLDGRVDRSRWTRAVEGVSVVGLSWSPDGARILATADSGAVEARDARSGASVGRIGRAARTVTLAALSRDGTRIAQILVDGTVRLVATDPLRELATWRAHERTGLCVAFTPDGSEVVTLGDARKIAVWGAADGVLHRRLEEPREYLLSHVLSADGRWLAAGTSGDVVVWDFVSGAVVGRWRGHEGYVAQMAFLDADRTLATASHDRTLRLWDVESGACRSVLRGHGNIVWGVDADAAGERLATASWDRTVRLWDAREGRELATLVGHTASVAWAKFSPDGRELVSCDDGSHLKMWSVERLDADVVRVQGKWLWKLSYWPEGASFLAIHGGFAERRDAQDGSVLSAFLSEGAEWRCGQPSPDGATVALGDTRGVVELWTADGSRRLARATAGTKTIMDLCWTSDGERIAIIVQDGSLRVLDRSGALVTELSPPGSGRHSLAVQPGGTLLATAAARGELCLVDLATGAEVYRDAPRFARVNRIEWSADGTRLALAMSDGRIVLWDARARATERELLGHEASVEDVAFSPDGARLVSGSADRSVRLWDPASGRELAAFVDHTHDVDAVAFSPDGAALLSGSSDSTLHLYRGVTAAERRVEELRARMFLARDVRAALLAEPDAAQEQQARLLALAERIGDDPVEIARDAWLLLRWPGSETHRLELARAMALAARAHAPDHPLVVRALAASHLRFGDPAAALAELDRARAAGAERASDEDRIPDALRAIALARLGRSGAARALIHAERGAQPDVEMTRLLAEARTALQND